MNARERYEKETGGQWVVIGTDGVHLLPNINVPNWDYVLWLEDLLTWRPAEEVLPDKGQSVFAHYKNSLGKDRIVRAKYLRRYQEEAYGDDLDFAEYSEEHDENFWPEGWYEQIDNWGDYSAVAVVEGEIDYWLPLPPLLEDV